MVAAVAAQLQRHEFVGWFYGDSIGFEGLLAAGDLLGTSRYEDFAHGFFRAWATRIEPFLEHDNTAPGLAMCEIVKRKDDPILLRAAVQLAEHLHARRKAHGVSITFEDTSRVLRQPYGPVALEAADQALMQVAGAGAWLDCMHFDPPFYAHLSRVGGGAEWAARAVDEILAYRDMLRDPETGLYCHYWLEHTGKRYIRGWGRGQGWGLLGLIDVAEYADAATPRHAEVVAAVQDLASRMLNYQQADGNWYALAHEPRSGAESSTAAFMATAFYRGIALGLLPAERFREPADRAYAAMWKNLDSEGNLKGVSAAVYAALIEEHYWYVPVDFIVPWGQGPVLTAVRSKAVLDGAR